MPPLSSLTSAVAGARPEIGKTARFQFSLRTLFLATLVLALLMFALRPRERNDGLGFLEPIDRSWVNGTISVHAEPLNTRTYAIVEGQWPNANERYTIRYALWLTNKNGDHVLAVASTDKLNRFVNASSRLERYPPFPGKAFQAVFDYEIWDGEPGKGTLLTKNSVFSPWYEK